MKKAVKKFLNPIILLALFFPSAGRANPWGTVPAFYAQYASFGIETLGLNIACGPAIPADGDRPCNPALASYSEGNHFQADILLGGDYSQIFKYAQYLDQNDKASLAQSIITQSGPSLFNGFASLGYTGQSFNVWASPFHSFYFSEVRNSIKNINIFRKYSLLI